MTREVAGALSHAELVALVVEQSRQLEARDGLIAELRALVATLEARVRDLEQQLAQRDRDDPTRRMPGLKPAATPRRRQAGPRKRRPHGFSWRRREATEQVVQAAATCPRCATPLGGGWVRWRQQVLAVAPSPVRVIEHVFLARRCPRCRRTVPPPAVAPAALGLPGAGQRLGVGLVSLLAALRAELRLPLGLLQWYLGRVHRLELSVGAIVGALHRVAAAGTALVAEIREAIRASPVVYAEETGLREDGANGYLWTFSTARERYFVHGRRTKAVVDAVLGPAFAGVLVTDFSAAYDHYLGPHQRCWAHLLRDLHTLCAQHPHDAALRTWAAQVRGVYARARRCPSPDRGAREREQRACEAALLAACQPYLDGEAAGVPQAVLARRLAKYLPELFTFVAEPTVPSTNNAAERSVRPVVVQRKISGGTRSPVGTRTFTTLATLFGTWRARGLDPLVACRQLLLSTAASPA